MSLTDNVVVAIKDLILSGRFGPGDRLPVERELAAQLGVSRSSLREGVSALSALGIIETRQGSGTYVTSLAAAQLFAPVGFVADLNADIDGVSFHAVRRLLETESARLAATRITEEGLRRTRHHLDQMDRHTSATAEARTLFIEADIGFHREIAQHCGNPVLSALVESFASRTARGRLRRHQIESGVEERTQSEHRDIWRALSNHDPEGAAIHMAHHLIAVERWAATGGAQSSL